MTDCAWRSEAFRHVRRVLVVLAVLAGSGATGHGQAPPLRPTKESAATLVIYNRNDPSSKELAEYYAERRRIPEEQVVGLSCPATEEITREDYRQTIERPLRRLFDEKHWWETRVVSGARREVKSNKIRFVALIRGMPLKIRTTIVPPEPGQPAPAPPHAGDPVGSHDEASVDSELALLGAFAENHFGAVPNPYFRRFTPIMDASSLAPLMLVARLDAPTVATVRRMIDDAIAAEQNGLWGWAYIDARSIPESGYREGDNWLRQAATDCWANGVPVILDEMPEVFPQGFPVRQAALYYGWYTDRITGAMADASMEFSRGAVAVHIHSFSAATLRDPLAGWTGPLLERGATASLGNVYEPYLTLTTHLDVFNERLLKGFTLAESAYIGLKVLSWMSVVVGDPLYRPYAAPLNVTWRPPSSGPVAPWVSLRRTLVQAGRMGVAQPLYLARYARQERTGAAYEALGMLQSFLGESRDALESLEEAGKLYKSREEKFRTLIERVRILQMLGNKPAALALVQAALKEPRLGWEEKLLVALRDEISPPPPPPSPLPTPRKP